MIRDGSKPVRLLSYPEYVPLYELARAVVKTMPHPWGGKNTTTVKNKSITKGNYIIHKPGRYGAVAFCN